MSHDYNSKMIVSHDYNKKLIICMSHNYNSNVGQLSCDYNVTIIV